MFDSKTKPRTPSRPRPAPLLLSHIKTSPTLRHAHSTVLPSPLSEWTSFPAAKASTWKEVEVREKRWEREKADGRRARGRAMVRDFEWGVWEQEGNEQRQRTKSLATNVLVLPPHLETRRISLGFQESLSPVLPSVSSSPALTTLLSSSPVLSKFVRGSPVMRPSSSCSSLDEQSPGGSRTPRPPPSRYSFSSSPPSPQTNFSRPMSLGVPRLDSPQSIGSSPMRTPVSSMKNRVVPRKRSALGESTYHNTTPRAAPSSLPPNDLFSSSIRSPDSDKTPVSVSATSTIARSSRPRSRRANTFTSSAASTPTPRSQPPLDLALLSSCISLSLSSPALSSFDAGTISRAAHPHPSPFTSSIAVDSPSRSARARSWTTSMSLGRETLRKKAQERRRMEVEMGLDEVMRLAAEVMEETEE